MKCPECGVLHNPDCGHEDRMDRLAGAVERLTKERDAARTACDTLRPFREVLRKQRFLERLEEHAALVALARAVEDLVRDWSGEPWTDTESWRAVADSTDHPHVQRAIEKAHVEGMGQ